MQIALVADVLRPVVVDTAHRHIQASAGLTLAQVKLAQEWFHSAGLTEPAERRIQSGSLRHTNCQSSNRQGLNPLRSSRQVNRQMSNHYTAIPKATDLEHPLALAAKEPQAAVPLLQNQIRHNCPVADSSTLFGFDKSFAVRAE